MGKKTIAITIDHDLHEQVKELNINLSGAVNEYMQSLIAKYEEDVEGINVRIERIKLEKALKKLGHWQNITKECQIKIEKWDEIQKNKQEMILEQEKEKIESARKCSNCGKILTDKMKSHIFKIGLICTGCFMNASAEDIRKWNQKK